MASKTRQFDDKDLNDPDKMWNHGLSDPEVDWTHTVEESPNAPYRESNGPLEEFRSKQWNRGTEYEDTRKNRD